MNRIQDRACIKLPKREKKNLLAVTPLKLQLKFILRGLLEPGPKNLSKVLWLCFIDFIC